MTCNDSENIGFSEENRRKCVITNTPDLADLLAAWGTLPEPVKAGIAAMVPSTRNPDRLIRIDGDKKTQVHLHEN